MIKNRMIQKRIKGKVLAVAMTAFMASLFVPMVGNAADDDLSNIEFNQQVDSGAFTTPGNKNKIGSPCVGGTTCSGHTITSSMDTQDGKSGIVVESGTHYIKLDGVNIKSAESVLQIMGKDTVVYLVLEGDNTLVGGNAGIYVAQDATLNIMESENGGTLKVKSEGDGAGIGGYGISGASTAGTINIKSGTIIAQGGNRGAGIGGSDSGTVQSVCIDGGCVVAKGGDGQKADMEGSTKVSGAPGIGQGNVPKTASGSITINGGNVTAIGGKHVGDGHASGIVAGSVTSKLGNAVIVSDGFGDNTNKSELSALVWDLKRDNGELVIGTTKITDENFLDEVWKNNKVSIEHGNICTVYGKVEMPKGFPDDFNNFVVTGGVKNQLIIPAGSIFKIPVNIDSEGGDEIDSGFDFYGNLYVKAGATIINPGGFHWKPGSDRRIEEGVEYQVSLLWSDITIKEPFTYKGEAYKTDTLDNQIFKVASYREQDIDGEKVPCKVDNNVNYEFSWSSDNDTSIPKPDSAKYGVEVKNAGKYTVEFTYGTNTHTKNFTIERLDITNEAGFVISPIPDKEYKDAEFESKDFLEDISKEIMTVKYNEDILKVGKDYSVNIPGGQKNVTKNATMEILGINNFKGKKQTTFQITPIKMTDENTIVTLTSATDKWTTDSDGQKSVIYDGRQHKPEVSGVSVKISEDKTIPLSDWGTGFDGSTQETVESNYYDAGTIKLTVTSKDSNVEGSCVKEYTIKPKPINVRSITPARTEREYETNANIGISKIDVDCTGEAENQGLIEDRDGTDERPIELPTGVIGIIAEGNKPLEIANVKPLDENQERPPYTEVWLDAGVCLAGKGGRNYSIGGCYTLEGTSGLFRLTDGIVIKPCGAPDVLVEGSASPDEYSTENAPKFNCNLKITASKGFIDPMSIVYSYRCADGEEQPPEDLALWDKHVYGVVDGIVTYPDILPDHVEKFYVKIGETDNVAASVITGPWSVDIPLYPRENGPSDCKLTAESYEEEGETLYKLTVEPYDYDNPQYTEGRYKYSLNQEGPYQYSNEFIGEPNSTYTAYVKYAPGGGYAESSVGTPTEPITTGEGKAKPPVIVCNETSPNEAGEIHFSGTATVKIEYNGKISAPDIYYTLDGSEPTSGSMLYSGEAITVDDKYFKDGRVTVKAKVIKPKVAQSEVTTVTLIKDGGANNPNNSGTGIDVELERLTEETTPNLIANTELPGKGIDSFDAVTQPLASKILPKRGYENENITYADLRIKIKGTDRYATDDDFKNAEGGVLRVTLTMDQLRSVGFPANYDGTTHNFAVSHMFASNIQRLGIEAGQSELLNVSKSSDGKTISFDLRGTSPVAFGWADVNNSDANPIQDPEDPTNPTDPEEPTEPTDPTDPENPTIDVDGEPRSADADGGTTTDTDVGTQGASNDAANALSDIMPKTGDPLSFVPWIAAAVVSVGAIVFFATRKGGKKKKKQTVKKTQAAKKKK